jgi:plastocyanin domain-containing protein
MNKNIIISIVVATALIIFAIVLTSGKTIDKQETNNTEETTSVNNVSIIDGKQIIEITAKGGYTPRKSLAKIGIPTILRVNTKGTFDCSSSIRISNLNISKILPQSGTTDIDLGIQNKGTINGSCGMGMYPFQIDFQ